MQEKRKKIVERTIKEFLTELGAKKPAPGGGSAIALTAAIGTSLLQMVSNFSLKNLDAQSKKEMREVLEEIREIKRQLINYIDKDAKAVSCFFHKPNLFSQKRRAQEMMRKIPEEVFKHCEQALKLIPFLARKGNKNLSGDLRIARLLLQIGVKGAKELMVR